MIKLLAVGLWICAVTLGSVYAAINLSRGDNDEIVLENPYFGGLDYVRGEVTSIPVISEGRVQGYFMARIVYTADGVKLGQMSVPPEILITDELYTEFVGDPLIEFPKLASFDIDSFRNRVRDTLNTRFGEEVIKDVLIEQIDYFSRDDIIAQSAGQALARSAQENILDAVAGNDGNDQEAEPSEEK